MQSHWDVLSPDLQSYILQLSKLKHIIEKKKEFVYYLNETLIKSYKFNIKYGLFFIHRQNLLFSIPSSQTKIYDIINILLRKKIYSFNQLLSLTEKELNFLLINKKFYQVVSFWRYHYFMKYYKSSFTNDQIESKWLQKINILIF